MHGVLQAQRLASFTPRDYHAGAPGQCCAPEPAASPGPRGVPVESPQSAGWLGFAGESARGGGKGCICEARTGTAAVIPAATSTVEKWVEQVSEDSGSPAQHRRSQSQEPGERGDKDNNIRVGTVTGRISPASFPKFLALGMIRFYQACVSPMMPLACRFQPTCSAYAFEAIEKWGLWKGGQLAAHRILRCRPWGRFGYDPVPENLATGYAGRSTEK